MRSWRTAELRQVLHFVREARRSLQEGDLVKAFRHYELALRGLSLSRGRACRPGGNVTATATLLSLVTDLGLRMEMALQPAPRAEATDLIPILFNGLKILQARGIEVDDEALLDRARNQAMAIAGAYRIESVR